MLSLLFFSLPRPHSGLLSSGPAPPLLSHLDSSQPFEPLHGVWETRLALQAAGQCGENCGCSLLKGILLGQGCHRA